MANHDNSIFPCGQAITVYDSPAGDLPQHQAERPNIRLLVGLEDVHADALVQHLRSHVALGAHSRVVAHVQDVVTLRVHDGQAYNKQPNSKYAWESTTQDLIEWILKENSWVPWASYLHTVK